MSHRNAFLAYSGRLQLARCIVVDGWPLRRAAERFNVSVPTAARWSRRYRELGEAALEDRRSRPLTCPHRTRMRTAFERLDAAAGEQALGAGADRVPPAPECLHGPPHPDPLPVSAAALHRPGHRDQDPRPRPRPPIRICLARGNDPRGHQEARPHTQRRRTPRSRPGTRRSELPGQEPRRRPVQGPRPGPGLYLPPSRSG